MLRQLRLMLIMTMMQRAYARLHQTRTEFPTPAYASNYLQTDGQTSLTAVSRPSMMNAHSRHIIPSIVFQMVISTIHMMMHWLNACNGLMKGLFSLFFFLLICAQYLFLASSMGLKVVGYVKNVRCYPLKMLVTLSALQYNIL